MPKVKNISGRRLVRGGRDRLPGDRWNEKDETWLEWATRWPRRFVEIIPPPAPAPEEKKG